METPVLDDVARLGGASGGDGGGGAMPALTVHPPAFCPRCRTELVDMKYSEEDDGKMVGSFLYCPRNLRHQLAGDQLTAMQTMRRSVKALP